VAETRVERLVRQVERIDVADAELDVRDPVLERVAPRVGEIILCIDTDDAAGRGCEADGDRAAAAAGVEDPRGRRQMR
jgi:hypothetical protein